MAKKPPKIGRPLKTPRASRVQLCVSVSAEIRHKLEAAARVSGRSLSSEAEAMLERVMVVDSVLAAFRKGVRPNKIGGYSAARK